MLPGFELNPRPKTQFEKELGNLQRRCKLLTMSNPKLLKGVKKNYITGALMLAPAYLSGYEVCAHRTPGCTRACLNTAGRGGIVGGGTRTPEEVIRKSNFVQRARLRRTTFLFEISRRSTPQPVVSKAFGDALHHDIEEVIKWAKDHKMQPCFRLNATSDLLWEKMPVLARRNIMRDYPKITFYDYTKWPLFQRMGLDWPSNYHLTYSWNETEKAYLHSVEYLGAGFNVAMVFSTTLYSEPLPSSHKIAGKEYPVIDGDLSDLRFLDPGGAIVGLRAKGFAEDDESGFVVKVPQRNPGTQLSMVYDGGVLFPDLRIA